MAPEIQTKHYVGTQVDVFAAGVILFIMYSGSPPFERAVPNDTYYKLIKDKNFTTFWNAHSKRRPPGFYPDDLKDLLNGMFAYNPS
jgi:serine/threonine protein kinase